MILECTIAALVGLGTALILTPLIYIPLRLYMEGNLREVIRDWIGPAEPRIRVVGPLGPDDVLFEGEEMAVKSMLSQIPRQQRRGWRIEQIKN